jgi:hypothetical protein
VAAIIDYISTTYIEFRDQWASYAIRWLRNYGIKVTSRTEGAHAELKKYLKNNRADLNQLHQCILTMLTRKIARFNGAIEEGLRKAWSPYNSKSVIGSLCRVISKRALKELYEQYKKAEKSIGPRGERLPRCTSSFTAQWGLPCAHVLFSRLLESPPIDLTKEDVDAHWWLHFDTVNTFFYHPDTSLYGYTNVLALYRLLPASLPNRG